MAKLSLTTITSGYASVDALNANNDAIETALENTLSRDGTSPNAMLAPLDLNSQPVVNLGAPVNSSSAARLVDISDSDATGVASAQLRTDLSTATSDVLGTALVGFKSAGSGSSGRTAQAKLRDVVSVADYTTVAAARTYAESIGAPLLIPVGVWNANGLTFECDLVFLGGSLTTASAAVINGKIDAPFDREILSVTASGAWTVSKTVNPSVRAAWFAGADIGALINTAVDAVTNGPATIIVPSTERSFSTLIDLTDTEAITLQRDGGARLGRFLIWTGGAGSGPALKAPGSRNLILENLALIYNSAAYNGNLVSLSSTGGAQNTSGTRVRNCKIGGQVGATSAARLIELSVSLDISIEDTEFNYAAIGVGASGGSNNDISIIRPAFGSDITDCAIKGSGHDWLIDRPQVQSDASPTAVRALFELAGDISGLIFVGGANYDGGLTTGTHIDLNVGGFAAEGVVLNGVNYNASSGSLLFCSDTVGKTLGITIIGGKSSGDDGLRLGRADGVTIMGHRSTATTPWSGTEPTRVFMAGNNWGANGAACGISVADDALINVSSYGDPQPAAGRLFVYVGTLDKSAEFALNADGTPELISGDATYFAVTDTDAKVCILYDGVTNFCFRLKNRLGGTRLITHNYIGR